MAKKTSAPKARINKKAAVKKGPSAKLTPPVETRPAEKTFSTKSAISAPPQPTQRELPDRYEETKLVLLPRDPEWLFAYWEINTSIRKALGIERFSHGRRLILRTYDITGVEEFSGVNANRFFDIDVNDYACSWYIRTEIPNRVWCADIGLMNENDEFIQIARSNVVETPSARISDETDEEWMIPDEQFEKICGLPSGALRDMSRSEEIHQQLARGLASGALFGGASERMMPGASERMIHCGTPTEKDFWLLVNSELIVYGATEPSASVSVQGKPTPLNADGTFSLRFELPDGKQEIPVEASADDGRDKRSTTIEVKKTTRH